MDNADFVHTELVNSVREMLVCMTVCGAASLGCRAIIILCWMYVGACPVGHLQTFGVMQIV